MSDIVERLRGSSWLQRTYSTYKGNRWEHINTFSEVPREAADTIDQMREAMRQIALALHEAGHTPKHGQSLADALRAALSAPAPAPAEAVAWQWRRKGESWSLDKTFNSQVYATTPDSEVRPLYAAPAAPAGWQPIGYIQQDVLPWLAAEDRGRHAYTMTRIYRHAQEDATAPIYAAPGAQGDA